MMILPTLLTTAVSVAFLLLLAVGDPKLRRAARLSEGHGRAKRSLYVLGTVTPGLLIALTGDAAMWLIWFGGCAVAGWLAALWFARSAQSRA